MSFWDKLKKVPTDWLSFMDKAEQKVNAFKPTVQTDVKFSYQNIIAISAAALAVIILPKFIKKR